MICRKDELCRKRPRIIYIATIVYFNLYLVAKWMRRIVAKKVTNYMLVL